MHKLLAILALSLAACSGGGSSTPTPEAKKPIRVERRGDSITQQAGDDLYKFVAAGSTVVNMGLAGATAAGTAQGTDGFMPSPLDANTYYTCSFGTNECLNNLGTTFLESNLNHIIVQLKGYRTVIEAPWLVVNPACHGIEAYRQVIVDLVAKYQAMPGYNIIRPELDMRLDHDGVAGIHLLSDHMEWRASLLADAIYTLK
jgi:hypothetical protein